MQRRIGHYQVISELGRGGMGVVFRAWDPQAQSHVAIKLLIASHNPKRLSRFRREVQVLQRLQHPNVVPIRGVGEEDGRPYLVMDLVEGKSLDVLIDERGPLPPSMVAEVGLKLASALGAAHELGILHRDVKPDNVLLRSDGEVVLGDFGLAKDVALEQSQLTVEGGFMGTPGYVSPEQAMGEAGRVGPAADVYGLGATLYHALTGQAPIQGHTVFEVMESLQRPVPKVRSLRSDCPKQLAHLVERCLKRELRERYNSCTVVEQDLNDFLRGTSRYEGAGVETKPFPWAIVSALVVASTLLTGLVLLSAPPQAAPVADVADPPPPPQIETPLQLALEEALSSASQGDWEAARAGYERVLVLDAKNPEGLHGLWQALMELRDPRQIEVIRRAVDVDPRPAGSLRLALYYEVQENEHEALRTLRRAHGAYPEDPGLIAALGRSLAKRNELEEAVPLLERAWELMPEATTAVALASCYQFLKRDEDALRLAAGALALEPDLLEARYLEGLALYRLERFREASVSLAQVWTESGANHVRSVAPLGASLLESGDPEQALLVYSRGIELEPESTKFWNGRAMCNEALGNVEEELRDLGEVLRLDPDQTTALNNRSVVLFQRKEYEAALVDAERLVELEPDSVSGWTQVGACQQQLKRNEAMLEAYARVVELEPGETGGYIGRGQAYHKLARYEDAASDYLTVLAVDPGVHALRYNLALAYASLKRHDEARGVMLDLKGRTKPGERHHRKSIQWLSEDDERLNPPE